MTGIAADLLFDRGLADLVGLDGRLAGWPDDEIRAIFGVADEIDGGRAA